MENCLYEVEEGVLRAEAVEANMRGAVRRA